VFTDDTPVIVNRVISTKDSAKKVGITTPVKTKINLLPKPKKKYIIIGSPQWSLSLRFPHQDPVHPLLLTHTRHMPSPLHHEELNDL